MTTATAGLTALIRVAAALAAAAAVRAQAALMEWQVAAVQYLPFA